MNEMPIYVTRQNADGLTGTVSLGPAYVLLLTITVYFNLLGWSIYGLVLLIEHLVRVF